MRCGPGRREWAQSGTLPQGVLEAGRALAKREKQMPRGRGRGPGAAAGAGWPGCTGPSGRPKGFGIHPTAAASHKKAFNRGIDMIGFAFQKDNWQRLRDETAMVLRGSGSPPRRRCSATSQGDSPAQQTRAEGPARARPGRHREPGRVPALRAATRPRGRPWG